MNYSLKHRKKAVSLMILLMLNQICFPSLSLALTSGPTQPELQSFEPVGASEMVDVFSGDFNYNIPLFDLPGPNGGYPVNLFYNSVTNADQESSIVGLGWNLGIGAINRQMRGLPDDFNGEKVEQHMDMKPNVTVGVGGAVAMEIVGGDFGKGMNWSGGVGGSLGFTLLYNSYKGFGFSLDPGITASMGQGGNKLTGGFGMSFNSLEGVSLNSKVGYSDSDGFSAGLSLGLNSRTGMKASLNVNQGLGLGPARGQSGATPGGIGGTFDLTYNRPAYSPSVGREFTGFNYSSDFSLGAAVSGFDFKFTATGFVSVRDLKQRYDEIPAYGSMYHHHAGGRSLQDFNREKDAAIRFKQPYLAIPSLTSDALSVTGHGIGGTYQLYRSDVPFVSDQDLTSSTGGFTVGVDLGFGYTPHFGFQTTINFSLDENKRPFTHRGNIGAHGPDPINYPSYEPYYYKAVGEMSSEIDPVNSYRYMGGDDPVRLDMYGLDFGNGFTTSKGASLPNDRGRSERKTRAMSIQPITNEVLLDVNQEELLPEFDVKYYDLVQNGSISQSDYTAANLRELNREGHNSNQIAGYTTISDGGARWNFALPARNKTQIDATFSVAPPANPSCSKKVAIPRTGNGGIDYKVAQTDEFLDQKRIPAYAHAYMLSSIYGADYVDTNPNDGAPNDLDKGYWMNIEYAKTSDNYKWRAPFTDANYNQGVVNKVEDDRGMFTYGEREQYHPARMETRTHVAEFYYEQRADGRGVSEWLQNGNSSLGDYSYSLTKVSIFSKAELAAATAESRSPIAMKNVHFTYDYKLCQGVDNNGNTAAGTKGKLTLKSVYFTYENNTRGALNPYKFEYNNSNASYEELAFDRWGVYRPNPQNNPCKNIFAPYVDQRDSKATLDAEAATWHLTDIYMPSGSHIKVHVERDDYSHEQNKVAGRMFSIKGVSDNSGSVGNVLEATPNPNNAAMTLYFDLESQHIPQAATHNSSPLVRQEIDRYFEDLYEDDQGKQLYFQIRSDILNSGASSTDNYQTVTGYTYIAEYGVVDNSTQGGYYTEGYIRLKPLPVKVDGKDYHPFLLSSWQFIKENLADQMFAAPGASSSSGEDQAIGQLLSVFGEVAGLFRDYYYYASDARFGTVMDLSRSFIRLASPDLTMYGGGIRVSKVTLHDDWTDEDTPVYGTVYEYGEEETYINALTGKEETRQISSGTATISPSIGKEECSLRFARHFVEDFTARQDKMHFFEHPINESYYPGASIGYRKVTVKSLASDYAIKEAEGKPTPSELQNLPAGFATSGVTVHEFYTAKDFPIITRSTTVKDKTNDIKYIPIPLIGEIRIDHYSGAQGYSVELNNMHGKPHKVTYYGQDINGHLLDDPVSSVEYQYQFKEDIYTEGKKARKRKVLDNIVPVLVSDKDPSDATKAEIANGAEIGVEREFFVDVREFAGYSGNTGVAINVDFIVLPIPPVFAVTGWGNINYSENRVRTAVTNKAIRRSGVLIKTIAYDGQSKVETDNKVFNRYTGQPVLTTVNNNYDDLVYNYTLPAHLAYDRMGSAGENWDMSFVSNLQAKDNSGYYTIDASGLPSGTFEKLAEGDEFILVNYPFTQPATTKIRATLIKKIASTNKLYAAVDATTPPLGKYYFKVVRSGRRNHLSAAVGSITALNDPTKNRTNVATNLSSFNAYLSGSSVLTSPTTAYASSYRTVDNVLATSATAFSDGWDIGDVDCTTGAIAGENSFRKGKRGVYRAKDTWTYTANRDQSVPLNTRIDGAMDNVPLFNWKNPFMPYSVGFAAWKKTQEITKYSADGNELENRNIIGLYSAGLYGYGDNLPIAVGSNANYYELAYEGFEEFPTGVPSNSSPKESGNFTFVERNSNCEMLPRQFNLVSNMNKRSAGVVVDADYYVNFPTPQKAVFNLTHKNGALFTIEHNIASVHPYTDATTGKQYVYLHFATPAPAGNHILPTDNPSTGEWVHFKGTAMLYFQQNAPFKNGTKQSYYKMSVSSEEAHTGDNSLEIQYAGEGSRTPPNIGFKLPQNKLLLQADGKKDYIFSAWVKVDEIDYYTYNNTLKLTIGGTSISANGPIVDGWQRIEGKFTPQASPVSLELILLTFNAYYFDDIRIFPSKGNMKSHVYDPTTYKTRASLDENNYFTRYLYDRQGSLIAVQKETPRGIKTIQETGSYVKEN